MSMGLKYAKKYEVVWSDMDRKLSLEELKLGLEEFDLEDDLWVSHDGFGYEAELDKTTAQKVVEKIEQMSDKKKIIEGSYFGATFEDLQNFLKRALDNADMIDGYTIRFEYEGA